ncbi:MAG: lamin tail domain-containing protein [bacterium]|nr:lamin tail domain-containing protein [bacterium]
MRMLRAVWILLALALAAVPAMAQVFGDVVITEVMYDDAGSPEWDFVEIHNTTASPIDISNWVLIDGPNYPASASEGAIQVPMTTMINPDQYLVLTKETATGLPNVVVCTQYFGSFTLGNSGDNIALYDSAADGDLIDGSLTVQFPDEGVQGNSIEKCDENATWTDSPDAWIPSGTVYSPSGRYLNCTPGAVNTPCAGDVTPPSLTSVTVISTTQLDVLFSEPVNQTIAETEANYSVNNGVGAPTLATRDVTNNALVHLTFAAMAPNAYQLTVLTVQDLAGNSAANLVGNFTILGAATNSVVITEIMYDDTASGANPDVEWVEIYNTTGATINIGGWILSDSPTHPITLEGAWYIPAGTTINAGQYLVLSEVAVAEFAGEIVCADSGTGSGLGLSNSGGDNLAIFTALTGDSLIHGSLTALFPDLTPTNGGSSIEVCLGDVGSDWDVVTWYLSAAAFGTGRYVNCTPGAAPNSCTADVIPPVLVSATVFSPNQVDAHFDESLDAVSAETEANYSVDFGYGAPTTAVLQGDFQTVRLTFGATLTPNTYTLTVNNVADVALNPVAANSTAQFTVAGSAYDIVFTEIMPNPNFAGTADSLGEWLEVYNRSATAVNLTGWIIADANGSDTLEGPLTLGGNDHLVFCSNGDSATNGGVPEDYGYHFSTSGWGLALGNGGETVSLHDPANVVVASVNYTGYPFAPGASAQLTDVNLDPANAANWCQATLPWVGANNGDSGTPGAAAICSAPAIPDTVTICQIRQQDTCGVAVWHDSLLVTYGIVTYNDSCRGNMYVESNGCAVQVFGTAARTNLIGAGRLALPGDSVMILGTLDRFAGHTEFSQNAPVPAEVTFISAGHAVPSPVVVAAGTLSQLAAACGPEAYESRHLTVNKLTFVETGLFAADSNFTLVDGIDTVLFRIDSCDALVGQAIPTNPVNLTGILAQYDTSGCYCQGYQFVVGGVAALENAQCGIPVGLVTLRMADLDSVQMRWDAPAADNCGCYYVWYSTASEPVFPADFVLYTGTPVSATTINVPIAGLNRRIFVVTGVPCP